MAVAEAVVVAAVLALIVLLVSGPALAVPASPIPTAAQIAIPTAILLQLIGRSSLVDHDSPPVLGGGSK